MTFAVLQKPVRVLAACVWLGAMVPLTGLAAGAALPARDLTVELRQIDEAKLPGSDAAQGTAAVGKSFSAGAAVVPEWEPQMVLVRNGEKAALRLQSATPMKWVQSAFVKNGARTTNAATNTSTNAATKGTQAAGVQYALSWFDAGQSMSVHPKWSGGKTAVLELEVQSAGFEPRSGADLPAQSRNAVSTTVTAPLAQWVTIAASGKALQSSGYSSESAQPGRRLLQIRVMIP